MSETERIELLCGDARCAPEWIADIFHRLAEKRQAISGRI